MPWSLRLRLGCVAATAAICLLWHDSPPTLLWFTYSLGFAHYALALRYSTSQVSQAMQTIPQVLSLAGLGLLGLFLYQIDFPFLVYFGLHHALNEAYAWRPSDGVPAPAAARLRTAAAVFQGVAYLTVLRFSPELAGVNPLWVWPVFAAAGAWFVAELWSVRVRTIHQYLDQAAPEITAAALVLLSLWLRIAFLQLVLFHFLLWAMLPLARLRLRGAAAVGEYAALMIGVSGVFVLLSPIGPWPARIGATRFTEQFLFWSYAHITLSFALSDAHPNWIVRFFRHDGARPIAAQMSR